MEVRKITVVINSTNETKTIETDATTLGQLKRALGDHGINTEGLVFFEGLTRTEMVDNDSRLPRDVERNGNITNNLVFMLTRPKANIKSGAQSIRSILYDKVREFDLQDQIQKDWGCNFTNCSNEELIASIENHENKMVEEELNNQHTGDITYVVSRMLDSMFENDLLYEDEYEGLKRCLEAEDDSSKDIESPYSQDEIEELFS